MISTNFVPTTAIEESQDLSSVKVDELIGSLQTFEIAISDKPEKKNKSITFVSNTEEDEDQGGESLLEAITLVGRKFDNYLKKLDKIWRTNITKKSSSITT